jgi:hypothetical protein
MKNRVFVVVYVLLYSHILYGASSRFESDDLRLEEMESGASTGSVMINSVGSRSSRAKNQKLTWQAMRMFEKLAPDLSISLRQTLIATMVSECEIRNDGGYFDDQDIVEALLITLGEHVRRIDAQHKSECTRVEAEHYDAVAKKEQMYHDAMAEKDRMHNELCHMLHEKNREQEAELERLRNAGCCGIL